MVIQASYFEGSPISRYNTGPSVTVAAVVTVIDIRLTRTVSLSQRNCEEWKEREREGQRRKEGEIRPHPTSAN